MRRIDLRAVTGVVGVARAVRLLGATAIVTGLRPEVAKAVVALDVDLSDLVLLRDLKSGIAYATGQSASTR